MRDIDRIVRRLTEELPGIQVEPIEVTLPGDVEDLWYLQMPGVVGHVQIESTSGNCPFLIESTFDDARQVGNSVDDVVEAVRTLWARGAPR